MPDLQRLTIFPFGCGCLKTVNDACIAAQIHSIFLQGIRLEAVPPDAPLNPVATHDSLPLLDERRSAKVLYKSSASSIVHFPSGFFSLTGGYPLLPFMPSSKSRFCRCRVDTRRFYRILPVSKCQCTRSRRCVQLERMARRLGPRRLVFLARSQDSRPRIGVFSALAARTGSKYSLRNAILPSTARRKTT